MQAKQQRFGTRTTTASILWANVQSGFFHNLAARGGKYRVTCAKTGREFVNMSKGLIATNGVAIDYVKFTEWDNKYAWLTLAPNAPVIVEWWV